MNPLRGTSGRPVISGKGSHLQQVAKGLGVPVGNAAIQHGGRRPEFSTILATSQNQANGLPHAFSRLELSTGGYITHSSSSARNLSQQGHISDTQRAITRSGLSARRSTDMDRKGKGPGDRNSHESSSMLQHTVSLRDRTGAGTSQHVSQVMQPASTANPGLELRIGRQEYRKAAWEYYKNGGGGGIAHIGRPGLSTDAQAQVRAEAKQSMKEIKQRYRLGNDTIDAIMKEALNDVRQHFSQQKGAVEQRKTFPKSHGSPPNHIATKNSPESHFSRSPSSKERPLPLLTGLSPSSGPGSLPTRVPPKFATSESNAADTSGTLANWMRKGMS